MLPNCQFMGKVTDAPPERRKDIDELAK